MPTISWAALTDTEKNCLVAENVFGLIPCRSRSYTPLIAGYSSIVQCEHTIVSDRPLHCYDPKYPQNYLTGDGMLEVIEKMRVESFFLAAMCDLQFGEKQVIFRNQESKSAAGIASDFPSATALAALRTVGIKIKD